MAFITKLRLWLAGGMITLKPKNKARGAVLLSYTTLPFVSPHTLNGHSNRWECMEIARIWKDAGFEIDIIDHSNKSFRPKKPYLYCIDTQDSLDYLSHLLSKQCIKIFHIASAHWKFQNDAESQRLKDIENKKGIKLSPRRLLPPSKNIEIADVVTMLGNDFTASTYAFAGKKIIRIPISTTRTFSSPENKDFEKARKNFIWLGGAGMAHKGLDLVLEAFVGMPEFNLTVFGKKDEDFAKAYEKELFKTPNIVFGGHIDLSSDAFKKVIDSSIAIIFPSASEGGGGSVIECMHAGLIPIVSYEASVDVDAFGVALRENTVSEIQKEVRALSSLPTTTLKERAMATWTYARTHHTRELFSKNYTDFVAKMTTDTL